VAIDFRRYMLQWFVWSTTNGALGVHHASVSKRTTGSADDQRS